MRGFSLQTGGFLVNVMGRLVDNDLGDVPSLLSSVSVFIRPEATLLDCSAAALALTIEFLGGSSFTSLLLTDDSGGGDGGGGGGGGWISIGTGLEKEVIGSGEGFVTSSSAIFILKALSRFLISS